MRVYLNTYFDTQDPEVAEAAILDLVDKVMIDLNKIKIEDVSEELEQIIENLQYDFYDNGDTEDSYESEG